MTSSIVSSLQQPNPSAIIELFLLETDLELHGSNQIYRFHNGTNLINNAALKWAGDEYIRLLGVIRPEDINNQNTVQSSRIANAKISYTGAGDIADPSKKGWFSKLIDAVQPL